MEIYFRPRLRGIYKWKRMAPIFWVVVISNVPNYVAGLVILNRNRVAVPTGPDIGRNVYLAIWTECQIRSVIQAMVRSIVRVRPELVACGVETRRKNIVQGSGEIIGIIVWSEKYSILGFYCSTGAWK